MLPKSRDTVTWFEGRTNPYHWHVEAFFVRDSIVLADAVFAERFAVIAQYDEDGFIEEMASFELSVQIAEEGVGVCNGIQIVVFRPFLDEGGGGKPGRNQ